MSILDLDKVDMIAVRPESSVVGLVITDHLGWNDFDTHCHLLQEKVNAYLQFVESGQLANVRNPPIPADPSIEIVLMIQYSPSTEAEAFLRSAGEFLSGCGICFRWEVRGRSEPKLSK